MISDPALALRRDVFVTAMSGRREIGLGEEDKYGRRRHLRVSVVPPAVGVLRTFRAVEVESENGAELVVISRVPAVGGEELAIEVSDYIRTRILLAQVTDSRITVVDGSVQYRLRLQVTTPRPTPVRDAGDLVGFLVRDTRIRLLDGSPAGVLFEASHSIDVGSVGSLRVIVHDRQVLAHILVARSQGIVGAGSRWLIGCQFLWLGLPNEGHLRRVFSRFTPPETSERVPRKP